MSVRQQLLESEHEETKYLKKEDIGLVISKGLAETYRTQPQKPIEFFAKWLIHYSKIQKECGNMKEMQKEMANLKEKNEFNKRAKAAVDNERNQQIKAKSDKKDAFFNKLSKSTDLHDNLEELSNFLEEYTSSTGVYIGKLTNPIKQIKDDEDENAHIDSVNP